MVVDGFKWLFPKGSRRHIVFGLVSRLYGSELRIT